MVARISASVCFAYSSGLLGLSVVSIPCRCVEDFNVGEGIDKVGEVSRDMPLSWESGRVMCWEREQRDRMSCENDVVNAEEEENIIWTLSERSRHSAGL